MHPRVLGSSGLTLATLLVGWSGFVPREGPVSLSAETLAAAAAGSPRQAAPDGITLTVLYDNMWPSDAFETGWGFSVLVETPGHTVLFDTGGDGDALLTNMRRLGKDPAAVEAVVFSHAHGDHVGGFEAILDLGLRPTVYVPEGFRASVRDNFARTTDVVVTDEGREIVPGVRVTGRVGTGIAEQALIVETGAGPLVLTGCSHPGVLAMVDQAKRLTGGPVTRVMGGFHLGSASVGELERLADELRARGVTRVGPSHCSGMEAARVFQDAYGEGFVRLGVGTVLRYRPANEGPGGHDPA